MYSHKYPTLIGFRNAENAWLWLAERCMNAAEPNREIDGDIAHLARQAPEGFNRATGIAWQWGGFPNGELEIWDAPEYTGSIDATAKLIEHQFALGCWSITSTLHDKPCGEIWRAGDELVVKERAKTGALALCAAFCKAKAELSAGRGWG